VQNPDAAYELSIYEQFAFIACLPISGKHGSTEETKITECRKWGEIMRKVTVKLEMRIVMSVDEGVEISNIVNELDYQINDTTTTADILDTEITDFEVQDSK